MSAALVLHNSYMLLFSAVLLYMFITSGKRVPGLGWWTFTLCIHTLGLYIPVFQRFLNPFFLTALPLFLLTAGGVSFYLGITAFRGIQPYTKTILSVSAVLVTASLIIHLLGQPLQYQLLFNALLFIFQALMYITSTLAGLRRQWYRPFMMLISTIYSIIVIIQSIRIIHVIRTLSERVYVGSPMEPGILAFTGLSSRALLFIINFIILVLVNAKLVHDLETDSQYKERLLQELKIISKTDRLTGILNRMSMETHIEDLIARGASFCSFGLLLIDIDDFKAVNDTRGHAAGDQVLTSMAQLFGRCIRGEDRVGRWGGDEFLMIIRAADRSGVHAAALRIQQRVLEDGTLPTVSIGTVFSDEAHGAAELIHCADTRMYEAKSRGKNAVVS
jgi:diguanylate cyclase (GGDEF)-like protein